MYLMQTVSAVPRARAAVPMDARHSSLNQVQPPDGQDIRKTYIGDFTGPPQASHSTVPQVNSQKHANRQALIDADIIRVAAPEEEEKDKKKDKKWTLGGLFRRKSTKKEDDSSDESEDDGKRGFLSRRKSKRGRRKSQRKSSANGFDVIIPQQKDQSQAHPHSNGLGKTAEELWSGSPKSSRPKAPESGGHSVLPNGPTRYIYRHPGSPEALRSSKESLQIPRHGRRDSNLSRNSSGGSGSLDGRKGRKEVMARAEAKRDQMREESSSDENDSYHSNSSLNRDRRSRAARTERHNKRLSRDEDFMMMRDVKSDIEGRRLPPQCRWISRTYYPDSSDHEIFKFNLMNHSGTPSPARSPRVRPKQMVHASSSVPLPQSFPMSTFPPGYHWQQPRIPNMPMPHAKETHAGQPGGSPGSQRPNRNSEYLHPFPHSSSEYSANRKSMMNYEQFLAACGSGRNKSLSFDQDIHRASYFENNPSEVMVVQIPIARTNSTGIHTESHGEVPSQMGITDKKELLKPDPPPRDGRRISGLNQYGYDRPHTLRPYGNETGLIGRIDSTSSLPVQPGNFPYQHVQRSNSGNSFYNTYENTQDMYYNQNRSSSYQHIPNYVNQHVYHYYPPPAPVPAPVPEPTKATVRYGQSGQPKSVFYWTPNETVPAKPTMIKSNTKETIYTNIPPAAPEAAQPTPSPAKPAPQSNHASSNLRYYADQNPRSRNPIHITCHATPNPSPTHDQTYFSDSQAVVRNPPPKTVKDAISNASEFWKSKDQEAKMAQQKIQTSTARPQATQHGTMEDKETPRSQDTQLSGLMAKPKVTTVQSDTAVLVTRKAGQAVLREAHPEEHVEATTKAAPEPPARRFSTQDSTHCFNVSNFLKPIDDRKKQNNLDDALDELESIYKSLHIGDDDLGGKAFVRNVPQSTVEYSPPCLRNKTRETVTVLNGSSTKQPVEVVQKPTAGVPDRVKDDLAYRRLNNKERADVKKVPPGRSYLLSSPALSPIPPEPERDPSSHEPDVTYDDVVFRNIRHANSTLRIQDPQPPFGIPIGPITPAPNSDYLHVTPSDRFRPTFSNSKMPDVVKDDLAFRNLRKDNLSTNFAVIDSAKPPNKELVTNSNFLLQKKRAVRSLSANIYNIMQTNKLGFTPIESNNNNPLERDCEKAHSLTDLTEHDRNEGKHVLETRLKTLKDEKNAKRAEFFEINRDQRMGSDKSRLSWTEMSQLNGDIESVPQTSTSTETLTEEREVRNNRRNCHQSLRVNFQTDNQKLVPPPTPERKVFRSPVVELSKYPAAAPASTLYGNPFKDPVPGSPLDEEQLEDLLSALAIEAKNTSDDLGRQLIELELSTTPKHAKIPARIKRNETEEVKECAQQPMTPKSRSNSLDTDRKSLSRSQSYEVRSQKSKSPEKIKERRSRNQSLNSLKKDDSESDERVKQRETLRQLEEKCEKLSQSIEESKRQRDRIRERSFADSSRSSESPCDLMTTRFNKRKTDCSSSSPESKGVLESKMVQEKRSTVNMDVQKKCTEKSKDNGESAGSRDLEKFNSELESEISFLEDVKKMIVEEEARTRTKEIAEQISEKSVQSKRMAGEVKIHKEESNEVDIQTNATDTSQVIEVAGSVNSSSNSISLCTERVLYNFEETITKHVEEVKSAAQEKSVLKRKKSLSSRSSSSTPREEKKRVSFELVTDLSEILQETDDQKSEHCKEFAVEKDSKYDVFQEVYEYNCGLLDLSPPQTKESDPGEIISVHDEVREILTTRGDTEHFTTVSTAFEPDEIEQEFEKLHEEVDSVDSEVEQLLADVTTMDEPAGQSLASRPFPNDADIVDAAPTQDRHGRQGRQRSPPSSGGKGEGKQSCNVWLACSYALAFALHLQEVDFLTALGIVLAIVSIIAILIL